MVNLKISKKWFVGLLISSFGLVGCGGVDFEASPDASVLDVDEGQLFPYNNKTDIFSQNDLLDNSIGLSFKVFDSSGNPVQNMNKSEFVITENGKEVSLFDFSSIKSEEKKADIVFVLDITRSMQPSLDSVKANVRDFVEQLRSVNILANLCLVTFADSVLDECTEFQSDDPSTPANENIDDFLNKLERIEIQIGGELTENSFQGLQSATEVTPWRVGAQRLTILITDADSWDATNPGEAGANAQSYPALYNSMENNRITSYIVGPDVRGYSKNFSGVPALAKAGNYFDFSELIESKPIVFDPTKPPPTTGPGSGRSLKDILTEIASSLSTVYNIKYDVNKNKLNPDLPVAKRELKLKIPGKPGYTIETFPVTATFPDGYAVTRTEWTLSIKKATKENIKVYLNNIEIFEGYVVEDGKLKFQSAPAAGAQIKVVYNNGKVSDGISLSQVKLPKPKLDNYKILVYYNGIEADGLDYDLTEDVTKRFVLLTVKISALDESDKYKVREKQGLYVTFRIVEQTLNVQ